MFNPYRDSSAYTASPPLPIKQLRFNDEGDNYSFSPRYPEKGTTTATATDVTRPRQLPTIDYPARAPSTTHRRHKDNVDDLPRTRPPTLRTLQPCGFTIANDDERDRSSTPQLQPAPFREENFRSSHTRAVYSRDSNEAHRMTLAAGAQCILHPLQPCSYASPASIDVDTDEDEDELVFDSSAAPSSTQFPLHTPSRTRALTHLFVPKHSFHQPSTLVTGFQSLSTSIRLRVTLEGANERLTFDLRPLTYQIVEDAHGERYGEDARVPKPPMNSRRRARQFEPRGNGGGGHLKTAIGELDRATAGRTRRTDTTSRPAAARVRLELHTARTRSWISGTSEQVGHSAIQHPGRNQGARRSQTETGTTSTCPNCTDAAQTQPQNPILALTSTAASALPTNPERARPRASLASTTAPPDPHHCVSTPRIVPPSSQGLKVEPQKSRRRIAALFEAPAMCRDEPDLDRGEYGALIFEINPDFSLSWPSGARIRQPLSLTLNIRYIPATANPNRLDMPRIQLAAAQRSPDIRGHDVAVQIAPPPRRPCQ
ncbi:hypothetical protein DFP72DRAFT_1076410 [Ephemerocybe angulata]|uniref:Uncharacterized protein n=1 Tax=Ephemerocybe angulata TaxID=980116 RepID=A0A8H6HG64_9AGAR|nr:hypothetical protein DFP72DRAFT_1076410 [Tulosesus angulatus]